MCAEKGSEQGKAFEAFFPILLIRFPLHLDPIHIFREFQA
jgi:hypothetical protein